MEIEWSFDSKTKTLNRKIFVKNENRGYSDSLSYSENLGSITGAWPIIAKFLNEFPHLFKSVRFERIFSDLKPGSDQDFSWVKKTQEVRFLECNLLNRSKAKIFFANAENIKILEINGSTLLEIEEEIFKNLQSLEHLKLTMIFPGQMKPIMSKIQHINLRKLTLRGMFSFKGYQRQMESIKSLEYVKVCSVDKIEEFQDPMDFSIIQHRSIAGCFVFMRVSFIDSAQISMDIC